MVDLDDIDKFDLMCGKKGIRMLPGNIFLVKHDKGDLVQKSRLIKEISSIFAVKGGEIGIGSHKNIFDGFEGQAGNRATPVILQMSQADQPDINGSLLQGGNRAGGGLAGDGDLDIGIFRDKGSKKRQKHVLTERGTDPDGETAYLLGYEGPYLILPGFQGCKRLFHVTAEHLTLRGQANAPGGSVKEHGIQAFLKPGNGFAHGRLGNIQLLGRHREIPASGHFIKDLIEI